VFGDGRCKCPGNAAGMLVSPIADGRHGGRLLFRDYSKCTSSYPNARADMGWAENAGAKFHEGKQLPGDCDATKE